MQDPVLLALASSVGQACQSLCLILHWWLPHFLFGTKCHNKSY